MDTKINPCTKCSKKDDDLFDYFEYGCDKPCAAAKQFFDDLTNFLTDAIKKIEELLGDDSDENTIN